MAFNAFLVQSPEPNLDEISITSLGKEKSLCMSIWVSLHVDLGAVWPNQV